MESGYKNFLNWINLYGFWKLIYLKWKTDGFPDYMLDSNIFHQFINNFLALSCKRNFLEILNSHGADYKHLMMHMG